jgi:hypothetical protein
MSVNDCLLHQELEQEHTAWVLSDMVLSFCSARILVQPSLVSEAMMHVYIWKLF